MPMALEVAPRASPAVVRDAKQGGGHSCSLAQRGLLPRNARIDGTNDPSSRGGRKIVSDAHGLAEGTDEGSLAARHVRDLAAADDAAG